MSEKYKKWKNNFWYWTVSHPTVVERQAMIGGKISGVTRGWQEKPTLAWT